MTTPTEPRSPFHEVSRRALLTSSALGVAAGSLASASQALASGSDGALAPGRPGRDYLPVVVPNGSKLSWKIAGGAKVFHLVAEEVEHEIAPGLKATCWGYNGQVHGPLIEAVEGDRFRVYVTNRLPAATTVHWHGLLLPNGMDGVGGLNQKAIPPGETFKYEFTLKQAGTFMYHSHHDEMTQMALGMVGMLVIHPRRPRTRVDRDFALMLHEWRIDPGARRPNPNEMTDFNILTINAKAFPGTEPLVVRKGQRVRIRMGNLSAQDHHPIHLHGYQFRVAEADGGELSSAAQSLHATVLIPVGGTRAIEFTADAPGDWAMHCHMTHHVMNQMGHGFPNMVGVKSDGLDRQVQSLLPDYMTMGQSGMAEAGSQGGMEMPVPPNSIPMKGVPGKHGDITMGGMFTVLKVRERLRGYADPGWFENPRGTQALVADAEELLRDEVDVNRPAPADASPAARQGG